MSATRPRLNTTESELIRTIRAITRLQTKARRLRRQLKATAADLRLERKHLRALQARLEERRPDVAPMRLYAGAVGIVPLKAERAVDATPTAALFDDDDEVSK